MLLGHQRLAIIDLHGGHQPMISEDGRLAVVFNGEIYNHADLRRTLLARGYTFRTSCDTEVLLYLYREHGERMTEFLRGMFAFAIWDRDKRTLFAARDRLGQKPFYYWGDGDAFAFCSELAPLTTLLPVRLEKDWQAIRLFFSYGYIPPPYTCYRSVHKLPPASQLTYADGQASVTQYWSVEPRPDPRARESDLLEQLDELVREAVRLRLMSDVPLGAFLSGGLDSSLIVAYMRDLCGSGVKTYSIGFADPTFDESRHADTVGRYLGVEHRCEPVRMENVGLLDRLARHFGEPFGDSSAIPCNHLSEFTRRGVTVALSGDGGDEIFGGYSRYLGRRCLGIYRLAPPWLRNGVIGSLLEHTKEPTAYLRSSPLKMLRQLHRNARRLDEAPDSITPNVFTGAELAALFPEGVGEPGTDPVLARLERLKHLHPIEQMMFLDAETYLEGDINVKVDRMSMAHSLEVRSPFLDHKLVEFMSRVPLGMKLRGFRTKFLLKKLGEPKLPREIVHRRKHGFSVPLGEWFRQELVAAWNDTVTVESVAPLAYASVKQMWETHQSGRRDLGYHLWHILMFCLWNGS